MTKIDCYISFITNLSKVKKKTKDDILTIKLLGLEQKAVVT